MTHDDDPNGKEARSWEFDRIFSGPKEEENSQRSIFKDVHLLVNSAIDGFNVCIFAYGQTGSGKTFTMFGSGDIIFQKEINLTSDSGLAIRAAVEERKGCE